MKILHLVSNLLLATLFLVVSSCNTNPGSGYIDKSVSLPKPSYDRKVYNNTTDDGESENEHQKSDEFKLNSNHENAKDEDNQLSLPSRFDHLGPEDQEEVTRAFSNINIPDNKLESLGLGIFTAIKSVSNTYPIADNITLTLLILRYLAEIGDYVVNYKDLKKTISGFLKLADFEMSESVWDLIHQVKKLKFGKSRENRTFVQVYTKNAGPLIYSINEPMGDDTIKTLELQNKTRLYFKDIKAVKPKESLIEFAVNKTSPFFLFPGHWFKKLNQVHKDIPKAIKFYVHNATKGKMPVKVEAKKAMINLESRKIEIKKLFVLPGISRNGQRLPSILFKGKTGFFSIRASIDQ